MVDCNVTVNELFILELSMSTNSACKCIFRYYMQNTNVSDVYIILEELLEVILHNGDIL